MGGGDTPSFFLPLWPPGFLAFYFDWFQRCYSVTAAENIQLLKFFLRRKKKAVLLKRIGVPDAHSAQIDRRYSAGGVSVAMVYKSNIIRWRPVRELSGLLVPVACRN